MNFSQAVAGGFRRYVDFTGRSGRAEYWWFYLFLSLFFLAFYLLEIIVGGPTSPVYPLISALSGLAWLGIVLPYLAVSVRRLHDTNRSGWWYLISFTIVGLIPLIIWYCTPGTIGDNQYGADPLSDAGAAAGPAQSTWVN